MSSHNMMNPYGGVSMGCIVESFDPNTFITRLRPGNLCEPSGADPHAGWRGGWGRKTPG